jgi:hypothetical protein
MLCLLLFELTLTVVKHIVLQSGRSAHGPIPKSRFNVDGYYHPDGARIGAVCSHLPCQLQYIN